jgi:hypothetical protein
MTTNYLVNPLTSSNLQSLHSPSTPLLSPHHTASQVFLTPTTSHTFSPHPITPPIKCLKHSTLAYSPGELGKLADWHAEILAQLGWHAYFTFMQTPHSINPLINIIPHPAAQYLRQLVCSGVPAIFTSTWSQCQCDTVYHRGPHPSAAKYYATFLQADMLDYVQKGYWVVLPYHSVW